MSTTDWALDPDVVHLNHGSFGGCPRAVLDAAAAIRARLEGSPMRFYVRRWQAELDAARARLAAFVGADPARLAFVPNATHGVALALAAAAPLLADGGEVVTTSHAYRACVNQLDRLVGAARIRIVPIELPYDPDRTHDAILAAVTPRTRLALLDHITSPTALILPVERLVPALEARGVRTIVDGAHAPGQVALDVTALGATWFTGNNHKWTCAPKATGFLVANAATLPLVTSHGASPEYGPSNRFHAELDWTGTHDPAPHLAVPAALDEVARLGGGWPAVIARNHALCLEMRERFCDAMDARVAIAPATSIGSMATIPIALPAGTTPRALEDRLLDDGWEVPIVDLRGNTFVRISAHLYTEGSQADDLARTLRERGVTIRA